jgi:hypothetical protein
MRALPRPCPRWLLAFAAACAAPADDTAAKADGGATDGGAADGGAADGGGADGGGTDGASADGGSADGGSADGGSSSDDAPTVTSADAWCEERVSGTTIWIWRVFATATDPQGTDTLPALQEGAARLREAGAELSAQALACDAAGGCSTSFDAAATGSDCARAADYTLQVVITDEDGNASSPVELTGRVGP